jgi:phosphoglycerol transferase MdoB-like AlkP superfamily enzyme
MLFFLLGSLKFLHPFQTKAGSSLSFTLWGVFSLVFCFFYVVDFAHYSYLSQRLNASVLNYLEDAGISMSMVWQSYPVFWIIAAIVAGTFLLLAIVKLIYNYILSKPITSNKVSRMSWGIVFFVLLSLGIFGRAGQYPLRWSDAFSLGSDYKAQVALNPFQSFFSSLNYRHATFDIKKVKEHYAYMSAYLGVDHPDSAALNFERIVADSSGKYDSSRKPNVIVVICESFSAYKSSMVGNPLNTTPFFNQMVQQGIYFDRCFSPSYGTARGVWAVITGTPDVQLNKTASRNPAAVDQHTIINNFTGYEKFYFLGGSTSWANIRGVLTNNIGGLHIYEQENFKSAKIDVWGISDKNLFLESNKILASSRNPFFAIIQTADNHRPYTIPEEDLKTFKRNKLPSDTLKKYGFESLDEYNAFRYTDFSYQQFIEAARKEKYFSNTIFVFVGDHGINGNVGNMLPRVFTDQRLSSEHVPLLFYAPALLKPSRYSFAASQLDVLPTLAGLAGISYRNNTLGKDLLQYAAGKKPDAAFIADPDTRRIGIVSNNLFYSCNINGSSEFFGSAVSNKPVKLTDSLRRQYRQVTDAWYQTARYLLFNNKKKK